MENKKFIYADHAATSALDPEAFEAMKEFLANIQATLPVLRKYIKEIEKLNKEELAKQYLKAAKELKSNGEYTGPMVAKIG